MAVPLNGFLPPPRHWEPPGWCSDNGAVPFKYHRPCEHLRVASLAGAKAVRSHTEVVP
jgi:hypothetical protein